MKKILIKRIKVLTNEFMSPRGLEVWEENGTVYIKHNGNFGFEKMAGLITFRDIDNCVMFDGTIGRKYKEYVLIHPTYVKKQK